MVLVVRDGGTVVHLTVGSCHACWTSSVFVSCVCVFHPLLQFRALSSSLFNKGDTSDLHGRRSKVLTTGVDDFDYHNTHTACSSPSSPALRQPLGVFP